MKAHRETLKHWLTQRSTAAFSVPTILITNVSTLILLNLLLFWHIHAGMEEILADYVHHEVTGNWISILPRIFLLVIIKDFFSFFVLNQLIIPRVALAGHPPQQAGWNKGNSIGWPFSL